ncbi:hypothetical protein BU24DRAFT_461304 [Aaosphaeria arxii CBS 175.79]|uniref:BTB domain-containing protein n=1 Tax=Aaosphaeria arxii CBS 175.79 TaxID=1450172 RepID=A0A6A5XYJ0_9PLEO|nr:uncharacterized protein BU24DRAFT_461304 [Aaosphaeria arxii CBS 175.79]KAF2018358.1 hypothetical protein BU24DRAFT_461304 [Aaosphaeria arxii CBS 175.79]
MTTENINKKRVHETAASELLTSSIITIIVGKDDAKESFSAHRSILCAHSEYFQRALGASWTESTDGVVNLPQDSPKIFRLWLSFSYFGKIASRKRGPDEITEITIPEIQTEYQSLCNLFCLSDKLINDTAKNATIEALFELSEVRIDGKWYIPPYYNVDFVYKNTPEQSPLRRLLVDFWSTFDLEKALLDDERLPKRFLADLAVALSKARGKGARNLAKDNGPTKYLSETKKEVGGETTAEATK